MNTSKKAIIIANGEKCDEKWIHKYLTNDTLVVVLDSAIERAETLGIPINVLIGDFDRNFDAHSYQLQHPDMEVIQVHDQDSTDLEKGLRLLIERGYTYADVFWATGKRMDHTLNNLTCIARFRTEIEVVFHDDYSRIFLLPYHFAKFYPKNTVISLLPIGTVLGITTHNLQYPLHNESLRLGYRSGSSNSVVEDGNIEISHTSGDLLLMECWD